MEATQSPVPGKFEPPEAVPVLTFPEAVPEILKGKKLHKLEWEDEKYFVFLEDNRLKIHKPDGKAYEWIMSKEDLASDDYIIL